MRLPLQIRVPGVQPGSYSGMSSAVEVMPSVLELLRLEVPDFVEGRSLTQALPDPETHGRDFAVWSLPLAKVVDPVHSVDNLLRALTEPPGTAVSPRGWGFLYSPLPGVSRLYNLTIDPTQWENVMKAHMEAASEVHLNLEHFMRETRVQERILNPRLDLRILLLISPDPHPDPAGSHNCNSK